MINYIISAMQATSSITNICPAENIFPLFRLQGSSLPACVVQLVATQPMDSHDVETDAMEHDVEITSIGENPREVWRLSESIRLRFQGWSEPAGNLEGMRFLTQATDVFESTDVFSVTQRYSVMEIQ
jgi:hypothetical protein